MSLISATMSSCRSSGIKAGVTTFCKETGISTFFGRGFKVFNDTDNSCALARIILAVTNLFCAITGHSTPVYAVNLNTAHDLLDAADVFGTVHLIQNSEKFANDRLERPGKHWGIKLLGLSGACSLLSFVDTLGFISLSNVAAKIGTFARVSKGFAPIPFMFAFSTFSNACAFAGFAKLYYDKDARDRAKYTYGNPLYTTQTSLERDRERELELANYRFKMFSTGLVLLADIATFGLASTSLTMMKLSLKVVSFVGKTAGAFGDGVKIQRAMYREQNLDKIKI